MPDRDTTRHTRFAYLEDLDDVLERLTTAEYNARSEEADVIDLGYRARALGASWREIADSVCITQQAATARWGTDKKDDRGRQARRNRITRLMDLRLGRKARKADYEHERKFVVLDDSVLVGLKSFTITQAYLWTDSHSGYTIRVRQTRSVNPDGGVVLPPATLTFKGPREGHARLEITQEIPSRDARLIIDTAEHVVIKERYLYQREGEPTFEIDKFLGSNEGLIIAEFEGSDEQVRAIGKPDWAAFEIKDDVRFDNEYLAQKPWSTWPAKERSVAS